MRSDRLAVGLTWWGEAPERPQHSNEAICIRLRKDIATVYTRRAVVQRWATAPTPPPDGRCWIAGQEGYAGQVGAFIGLTHQVSWYLSILSAETLRPLGSLAHQIGTAARHLSHLSLLAGNEQAPVPFF